MKALTVWQPWAWAIAEGLKPIENRSWKPPAAMLGQEIAIHAGVKKAPMSDLDLVGKLAGLGTPTIWGAAVDFGAIIAVATIASVWEFEDLPGLGFRTRCILGNSKEMKWPSKWDEWAFGPYCWQLSDVRKLKTPAPCKGNLGLWNVPEDVVAQLEGK